MTGRLVLLTVRVVVNVLVVGVLGGSGYLIYLVADTLDRSLDVATWFNDLLRTYRVSRYGTLWLPALSKITS